MSKEYYVVVGLGKTGLSCVKFCLQKGWPVCVTDSRPIPPGLTELNKIAPYIRKTFGKIDAEMVSNAKALIISPGISIKEPTITKAIQDGVPYVGDIEIFVQNISAPIVAITGSNAKSTVTALVGAMAQHAGINAQVAGNIGTPVLDLLNQPPADLYILELSSFQLETTHSLQAKVATILNICEDHMDRYNSIEEYIAAKMRIYTNCETAIINRAEKLQRELIDEKILKNYITFGPDQPHNNHYGLIIDNKNNETFLVRGEERLLNINKIKLPGKHNITNALSALAIGEAAGIDQQAMLETLQTFAGLPHRCQLVLQKNKISWYNDSKGTNVGATIAAIQGLGETTNGKIILIAGGLGKDADFSPLKQHVKKYTRTAILIGEAAAELQNTLQNDCDIIQASDLEKAIQIAKKTAHPGDIVLLSPACASFDMFKNYEHRGNEFIRLVKLEHACK